METFDEGTFHLLWDMYVLLILGGRIEFKFSPLSIGT